MKRYPALLALIGALAFGSPAYATVEQTNNGDYLHNATASAIDGKALPVSDFVSVGVLTKISGAAEITFEVTPSNDPNDSTNWNSKLCTLVSDGSTAAVVTTSGVYQCNTAGMKFFRARVSNFTSGTVTVFANATTAVFATGSGGSSQVSTLAGCWATVAQPSYVEGVMNALSCTLSGLLRVSVEAFTVLLSCEDQSNTLCMISGGPVRSFPVMIDVTDSRTSGTTVVHSGGKTPMASLTGTGALTGTVTFYGDMENTTTNGEPLCALVLDATTKGVKTCNQFTRDFPYYHAVSSNVTGTSATIQATIMVGAVGSQTPRWQLSGVKTSDALIKTGFGELQCVVFSPVDGAPVSGTIAINDATSAGTGTAILPAQFFTTTYFVSYELCLPNIVFTTGLYFDFTTTSDVSVQATYR